MIEIFFKTMICTICFNFDDYILLLSSRSMKLILPGSFFQRCSFSKFSCYNMKAFCKQEMAGSPISFMGLLLLCFGAASTEAFIMKYKDPKQPLNVRIEDLMSRMTLEEKIGQMVQIDKSVASALVMKKYRIGKIHDPPL